jgi:hypothetical protein
VIWCVILKLFFTVSSWPNLAHPASLINHTSKIENLLLPQWFHGLSTVPVPVCKLPLLPTAVKNEINFQITSIIRHQSYTPYKLKVVMLQTYIFSNTHQMNTQTEQMSCCKQFKSPCLKKPSALWQLISNAESQPNCLHSPQEVIMFLIT